MQEAQSDWLFEKHAYNDIVVFYSDEEDEEVEMLVGLMMSQLSNETQSFRDSLVNLMQRALK